MKMNTHLNIEDVAGSIVVPVRCGSERGTAFFISPTKLLTAFHVVAEHVADDSDIFISVNGITAECTCEELAKGRDIAILTCVSYKNECSPYSLLTSDCRKGQVLSVVGYPEELGNGVDAFSFSVVNVRTITSIPNQFDIVVRRIDSFALSTYIGMSGAPVINDFGSVVGAVTDELYNSLGYTSILSVMENLAEKGIKYENNADLEDTSDFGLGKCFKYILEAQEQAGSRYSHDLQVDDYDTERIILRFAGIGFDDDLEIIANDYKKFSESTREVKKKAEIEKFKKQYVDNQIITDEFVEGLYQLKILRDKSYPDSSVHLFTAKEREQISDIISKAKQYLRMQKYLNEKGLAIVGDAGCGKTFTLCKISEKLCKKENAYLLFGTDFSASEMPLETILRKLKWKQPNSFDLLNDKMQKEGKFAIFIIDAINEGAGMYFYSTKLPTLLNQIRKWRRIKIIVSIRKQAVQTDVLNETIKGFTRLSIPGFRDVREAVKKFFEHYNVDKGIDDFNQIQSFSNPLFLKIFCEAYSEAYYRDAESPNIIEIYNSYIYKRNHVVSIGADADPRMNFTKCLLERIAYYSLWNLQCGDIPREKAKSYSYRLCPYRMWSKDLLNNTLKANLLMEYKTYDGMEWITFEYDSMGDYLKAYVLLRHKVDDYSKLKFLCRLVDFTAAEYQISIDNTKIFNFIKAFLSIWNPPVELWHHKEIINGKLTDLFIESLALRNVANDLMQTDGTIMEDILDANPNYLQPDVFINLLENHNESVISEFHGKLFSMSMGERDTIWSASANSFYYIDDELKRLWNNNGINKKSLLVFEVWLLSASYPSVRFPALRHIVNQLEKTDSVDEVLYIMSVFKNVNDPYVLQGLYAAIYGYIVRKRNSNLSISSMIVESFYSKHGQAPHDFVLRHWTLKILEWQWHLSCDDTYWKAAQPPYDPSISNPYENIPNEDIPEDFFGTNHGADSLHRSLFVWDFYRYTMGGNTSDNLDKFIGKDDKHISIKDTAKAIALLIKNKYGWNEALDEYDSNVPYESGHYHRTERIGKKYQWIGLSEVYAYLLDTCKLCRDRWSQKKIFRAVNYPWLVSNRIYLDPSLRENDTLDDVVKGLFDEYPKDSTIEQNIKSWIDDEKCMPPFDPIQIDRDGGEWVVLQGYDTRKENDDVEKEQTRERFLYYNTCLVDLKNKTIFAEWAKTANFYGRWMPESTGSIDFLWNDYPWANTYTSSIYEDGYVDKKIPCDVELTYEAELQEDFRGIQSEENIASTVYAPCRDIMESLGLYTAERGIVRKSDNGEIVAINRLVLGESFHGLLIKRTFLNEYLKKQRKCLFYCLLGEKNLISAPHYQILVRNDLTGAALYKENDVAEMIQPLRFEPREEPEKEPEGEDEYGLGMPIEKWLAMPKQSSSAIIDRLKELAELSKQNGAKE